MVGGERPSLHPPGPPDHAGPHRTPGDVVVKNVVAALQAINIFPTVDDTATLAGIDRDLDHYDSNPVLSFLRLHQKFVHFVLVVHFVQFVLVEQEGGAQAASRPSLEQIREVVELFIRERGERKRAAGTRSTMSM